MSALVNFNQSNAVTMTSREISDLVESRHDKVKQSIERLVDRGVISNPPLGDGEKSANGVVEKLYLVSKRDSYIIVAQLSPEFTARLVDRWQELEAASALSLPKTYLAALKELVSATETIESQALQLDAAQPSIEFVDKYVDTTGTKGFRQVCKLLKANESRFREFIKEKKIMYKLGGEWMPHAQHLDTGRFEIKAGKSDVNGHAFNSARFTPKGIAWVAGEFAKFQLEIGGAING